MKCMIPIASLLLVSGCATARPYANCPNAKAALALAERVVDRVCLSPMLKDNGE